MADLCSLERTFSETVAWNKARRKFLAKFVIAFAYAGSHFKLYPKIGVGEPWLTKQTGQHPAAIAKIKSVGKLTLDRNPDNFFAGTEQAAFHVGNIVPGIDSATIRCCKAASSRTRLIENNNAIDYLTTA